MKNIFKNKKNKKNITSRGAFEDRTTNLKNFKEIGREKEKA